MTSFGATKLIQENVMPIFKIQAQIYHLTGSLLPTPNSNFTFFANSFYGRFSKTSRSALCTQQFGEKTNCGTIPNVFFFFNQHNELVALFTTALDSMPSDNYKIVIKADKTPAGQHARCFNAPNNYRSRYCRRG